VSSSFPVFDSDGKEVDSATTAADGKGSISIQVRIPLQYCNVAGWFRDLTSSAFSGPTGNNSFQKKLKKLYIFFYDTFFCIKKL
jgi:hypothetical protein